MVHTPATLRTVKVPQVTSDDNPFHLLIAAILARALADAQGQTFAPGSACPAQLQEAARQWLADEAGPRDLVELAGYDADVVLRYIRRVLQTRLPVGTQPQLNLF